MFFTQFDDAGGGNVTASFGIIRSTDKGADVVGTHRRHRRSGGRRARPRERHIRSRWDEPRCHRGRCPQRPVRRLAGRTIFGRRSRRHRVDPFRRRRHHVVRARADQPRSDRHGVRAQRRRAQRRHDRRHAISIFAATRRTRRRCRRTTGSRARATASPGARAAWPVRSISRLRRSSGGLFLGDYQALVAIGELFVPFYATTNNGDLANRTDIFASLMSSAGAAAASAQTLSRHGIGDACANRELHWRRRRNLRVASPGASRGRCCAACRDGHLRGSIAQARKYRSASMVDELPWQTLTELARRSASGRSLRARNCCRVHRQHRRARRQAPRIRRRMARRRARASRCARSRASRRTSSRPASRPAHRTQGPAARRRPPDDRRVPRAGAAASPTTRRRR